MKHIFTLLLAALSLNAMAQSKAYANVSATIVRPVSISQTADFSNIALRGTAPSVIAQRGEPLSLGASPSGATSAKLTIGSFTVNTQGDFIFTITLQLTAITVYNGTNSITVGNFISTHCLATASAGQALNIGATVNFAANQPTGRYSSPIPFCVTVNYN